MKNMLKAYFGYGPFYFYFVILSIQTFYIFKTGLFFKHWYWLLIIPFVNPFFEWVVHKYILHAQISAKNPKLYKYMKRLHYDHHEDPANPKLLFAQLSASLSIFIFWAILIGPFLGVGGTVVFLWGTIMAYLFYEWVHLGHHIDGYNHLTPYGQKMRKYHRWHHFKNENYWWGITSHLGDIVLGTCPDVKKVTRSDGVKKIHA